MYTLQEPLLLLHSNIITKSTFLLELLLQVVSTLTCILKQTLALI